MDVKIHNKTTVKDTEWPESNTHTHTHRERERERERVRYISLHQAAEKV